MRFQSLLYSLYSIDWFEEVIASCHSINRVPVLGRLRAYSFVSHCSLVIERSLQGCGKCVTYGRNRSKEDAPWYWNVFFSFPIASYLVLYLYSPLCRNLKCRRVNIASRTIFVATRCSDFIIQMKSLAGHCDVINDNKKPGMWLYREGTICFVPVRKRDKDSQKNPW